MTNFGAFVELEEGIEGLCHVSELDEKHVEKPTEFLNIGQEIEMKVIKLNLQEKKIGLSLKAMKEDEPRLEFTSYLASADSGNASMGERLGEQLQRFKKTGKRIAGCRSSKIGDAAEAIKFVALDYRWRGSFPLFHPLSSCRWPFTFRMKAPPASLFPANQIAALDLEGVISDSKEFVDQLKDYGNRSGVRSVVIRINSPGGGVAASQEIYEAIKKFRAETKKKVVVSMASVAASGGYYIACGADKIFANPGNHHGKHRSHRRVVQLRRSAPVGENAETWSSRAALSRMRDPQHAR